MASIIDSTLNIGAFGNNPPHVNENGDALYQVLSSNGDGSILMKKSTDNGSTWADIGTATEPQPSGTFAAFGMCSTIKDGNLIHVARMWRDTSLTWNVHYARFNMATDSWVTTSFEDVRTAIDQGGISWVDITHRSDGTVVVVYMGETDTVKGKIRTRVDYARRSTGGTWTAGLAIDAGGAFSYGNPNCVLAPDDEVHILWGITDATDEPPVSWQAAEGRTLNVSNGLSTTVGGSGTNWQYLSNLNASQIGNLKRPITWADGATQRIALLDTYVSVSVNYGRVIRGTEDGSGDIAVGDRNTDAITPDPAAFYGALAYDPASGNIYCAYVNSADSDVYYAVSTDEAASFATGTEVEDAVTATLLSASIYTWAATGARYLAICYTNAGDAYFTSVQINDPSVSQLDAETLDLVGYDPTVVTTEKNVSEINGDGTFSTSAVETNPLVAPSLSAKTTNARAISVLLSDAGNDLEFGTPTSGWGNTLKRDGLTESPTVTFQQMLSEDKDMGSNPSGDYSCGYSVGLNTRWIAHQFSLKPSGTISWVGGASIYRDNGGASDGTDLPITHGLTISSGDTVVAIVFANPLAAGEPSILDLEDDNGSFPFTRDYQAKNLGNISGTYAVFSRVAGASEPATYNFKTSGIKRSHTVFIRVYSNVDTADIYDQSPQISDYLALQAYPPDAVTTEFTPGETSILPAETLDLIDFSPQAVTTENQISQLDAETLDLTGFDPQSVTTENHFSQLDAETLDLTGFDPQVVTSNNNRSLLDAETLDLTDFDPQVVTTENQISQLDAETLDVAANGPQAVTTENNTALLIAASLSLSDNDPTIVTTENNKTASGAATLTQLTASGTADTLNKASGAATLDALTASGTVTTIVTAQGGKGTFTYVGGASNQNTGVATISLTHGLPIQAGDLVVAYVHSNQTGAITPSDTWAAELFDEEPDSPTETSRNAMYWKVATGSEPATYQWTHATANYGVVLKVFRPSGGTIAVDLAPVKALDGNSVAAIRSVAQNGRTAATDAVSIIVGGKDNRTAVSDPIDTVDGGYTAAIGNGAGQITGMAHKIGGGAEPALVQLSGSIQADISYAYHVSFVTTGITLEQLTASGTASQILKPSGAATLEQLTASGTARALTTATGAATLEQLTASGTASQILKPSGAATLDQLTASGVATRITAAKTASGNATLTALTASGTAARRIPGTPKLQDTFSDASTIGTTTSTSTFNVAAGETIVVFTSVFQTGPVRATGITDTAGNTYRLLGEGSGGDVHRMQTWVAYDCAAQTNNIADIEWSGGPAFQLAFGGVWSGLGGAIYGFTDGADVAQDFVNFATSDYADAPAISCSDTAFLVGGAIVWDSPISMEGKNGATTFIEQGAGGATDDWIGVTQLNSGSGSYDISMGAVDSGASATYVPMHIAFRALITTASGATTLDQLTASGTAATVLPASGAATLEQLTASGSATKVGEAKTASGNATLTALTASGTASQILKPSGAATLEQLTASGTVTTIVTATGAATLNALTASGTASQILKPSGAATLEQLTASGTAGRLQDATGATTLEQLTASGTASQILKPSGAATLEQLTANGVAVKGGERIAFGAATLDTLTASGTASQILKPSGTATLDALTASGTVTTIVTATGAATLDQLTASGTASQILKPSGAATLEQLTASGTVTTIVTATGAATLTQLTASGTADAIAQVKSATGAATLTQLTASGSAGKQLSASGAATLTQLTASGTADTLNKASGAATLTQLSASGSATIVGSAKFAFGSPQLAQLTASGSASQILKPSGAATLNALTASGTTSIILPASGTPQVPQLTSSGVGTIRVTATGASSINQLTASGVAKLANKAFGSPQLTPLTASGLATRIRTLSASGNPALAAITATGTVVKTGFLQAFGAATLEEITGRGLGPRVYFERKSLVPRLNTTVYLSGRDYISEVE